MLNCGTIKFGASFPSQVGDNNIPRYDDLNSTQAKVNCLLQASVRCQGAFLRSEYSTWESYAQTEIYRVKLDRNTNCKISRDGYASDLNFFKTERTTICSDLKIVESGPLHYGNLDDSDCK